MAKAKSTLFSVLRGSIAGITYTANSFSAIVARNRTIPVNPNTEFQQIIRDAFTWAEVQWNLVVESIRVGWRAYASTVSYSGPVGSYQVTGRHLFIATLGLRRYMVVRGATFTPPVPPVTMFDPPDRPGLIVSPSISVAAPLTGTGASFAFSNLNNFAVLGNYNRSYGYNAARTFFKGPFLGIEQGLLDIAALSPQVVEFTNDIEGLAYWVKSRLITKAAPHRISLDVITRYLAQASP